MTRHQEARLETYRERYDTFARLPGRGRDREAVLGEIEEMAAAERDRWRDGFASGAVYHGGDEHIAFVNRVYAAHSQSNPLHPDLWPSALKFEQEIVAMTAHMLGAEGGAAYGAVSSGGTESITLAMKAYRNHARSVLGIADPQLLLPSTAHPAFDKAAHTLGIEAVRVPVGPDGVADVAATEDAIIDRTAVIVGSAPSFPHGLVDPIGELSELARTRGIGFHTDACLGGFLLPWAERLGYDVPAFDFRLPGVTSISADTHKFGYAPKGTSVVLYGHPELRRHQYFTATDWSGGLYCSPGFPGSRPGGLVAACWAAMVSIGEDGYLEAARRILETASAIKDGIRAIPELEVVGDPLFTIALASSGVDVYRIMDAMTERGWSLNGLQRPPALHVCVTLRHTQPGVAERFLDDLRASVAFVKDHPDADGGMAPIYGMANTIPDRGVVRAALLDVVDGWLNLP